MVMYGGHVVESGPTETVLSDPQHPYTQLLLSAVPDPRAPLEITTEAAKAEPPAVIDPKPGCRFRARCPIAVDQCAHVTPRLQLLSGGGAEPERAEHATQPEHNAACHVTAPAPAAS